MSHPLFSIIMASYNAEKTIEKSIQCVRNQNFKNFEFVIIDGGSKDNTLAIIKNYNEIIHSYISEPDKGIYDAWNKGLKLTRGEWILFIGSDDYLLPDTLCAYQDFLNKNNLSEAYYVSSKVQIISNEGIKRRVFGWPWTWQTFRNLHIVAHPGSLHRRILFEKYGIYNTNFKIASDYELLLRPKENLKALFMDKITLEMTEGGVSASLKTVIETRSAQLMNNVNHAFRINVGFLYQLLKLAGKRVCAKFGINVYIRKEFNSQR